MMQPEIFKANDIRGIVGSQWDVDDARALGAAWVDTIDLAGAGGSADPDSGAERGPGALVLGRDMRVSSPELSAAFAAGVVSRGVDVIDIGLASTDELWFASGRLDLPGVMFTASHNPGAYNGIKFCFAQARPVTSAVLTELRERALRVADSPAAAEDPTPGTITHTDLLPAYAEHLLSLVDLSALTRDPNRRLTVVADAGNGMAGHTLPSVLGQLELDLVGLYTELDGSFPHHPPNPLEPENLLDAQRAVVEHSADVGLVFDGDADRCFIIDETGAVVSPSAITALIASQELAREPGATIVRNLITSRSVAEVVAEHGGVLVTTKVGHTFVKAAMAEHGAIFGGEHSAHYYFRDFWGADTGMLAALHVLAAAARSDVPLSQLVAGFTRYAASGEINSTVADAPAAMRLVAQSYADRPGVDGEPDWTDGLTVNADHWWLNLRASNTEPLLRLNVEAVQESTMTAIRDEVLDLVRQPPS